MIKLITNTSKNPTPALLIIAFAIVIVFSPTKLNVIATAYADESSHAAGNKGGHDSSSSGHDSEGHNRGHRGGLYKGQHGLDHVLGGGKSIDNTIFRRGNRPVWAQEGIPDVELGRLNVARSPSHVLLRAEDEALANFDEGMVTLYNLSAEQAATLLTQNFSTISRYESPLQNLALYKDVMIFGNTQLAQFDSHLAQTSQLDLAAIFLGSAADKTIMITENTVIALNKILGLVELNNEQRSLLTTKADLVRQAILTGHGPVDEH